MSKTAQTQAITLKLASVKFGIMIKQSSGEYVIKHYGMTALADKVYALKGWCAYLTTPEQHWICPGKDFYLDTSEMAHAIYKIIDLLEISQGQKETTRMQFWDDTQHLGIY